MRRAVFLAALMAVLALAIGGTAMADSKKSTSSSATLSSETNPERDKRSPYEFKTEGKLKPKSCPKGNSDNDRRTYCEKPSKKKACKGTVRVDYYQHGDRIRSRTDKLDDDCEYKVKTSFGRRDIDKGKLTIVARFLGNNTIDPVSSSKDEVRVG
jgi:hypothetical protein